ncbi:MAG: hypothetical protein GY698_16385 [Actinomycetia bacterium]|nr:hypothetical protein [Actinomycetes bacterium]
MELGVFDEVGELVRSMAPPELGEVKWRAHRRGVKVWFDTEKAGREHFEAQQVARRHLDGTDGMVIEVGFHAEHGDEAANQKVVDRLLAGRDGWHAELGDAAVAGPFLGNDGWRRLSETWIEPDLDDPDLSFELGSRLVDYVAALEALRRDQR